MQLIKKNPYRIIGLLAGATAKEQDRQIKRLKQYLSAEQDPEGDYSFPTLGKLDRTLKDVTEATSKLTLDNDKITAALFWFYNGNTITDEPAFESLKDGKIQDCTDIWVKLMASGEVTKRNSSAYHNLSTLLLRNSFINSGIDVKIFADAIFYKIKFLESEFVKDFITRTTDETFKINKEQIELIFLRLLHYEVERHGGISTLKFLEIINNCKFAAKDEFIKMFVNKPIEQIELKIIDAKNNRKAKKANGAFAGHELYKSTKDALSLLRGILGITEMKYIAISDKVSNEILQCSIDFFNDGQEKDTDIDYLGTAMILTIHAKELAIGRLTKERINESIIALQEMKDREIYRAIDFLKSVKDSYLTNEKSIRAEVKKLEETDLQIKLGYKTINWSAVENNIKNSIDWQKVNELLLKVLSDNNLKKIKESDKSEQKKEFLDLMIWLERNSLRNTTASSLIDKYKKIPPKLPFKIISSEITNTNNKPLYTKYIRFIGLKINVQIVEEKSITLLIKYLNPDGSLRRNISNSPKGYSRSETYNLYSQLKTIEITGWGNSDNCIYDLGKNRIELYVDDFLMYFKEFNVDLAPSDKLEIKLKEAETKLAEIKNTQFFNSELESANSVMNEIKKFHLFRSASTKQIQISEQQRIIADIELKGKNEKERLIEQQNNIIIKIKLDIQNAEY